MNIEVIEEGLGRVVLTSLVPDAMKKYTVEHAEPLVMTGTRFKSLLLAFSGKGFTAWYNRFWIDAPTVVRARADMAVLELRIALRHRIKGTWEHVEEPGLPSGYFQMAFVPHVMTRAIFEAPVEYQTFDIHFELPYLAEFGLDYQLMDRFINRVQLDQPAELAPRPYKCNNEMLQLIGFILQDNYSAMGKQRQLNNHISSILGAALEEVSRTEGVPLPLSNADKAALHEIRDMIEKYCPDYLSNDVLLSRVYPRLNAFKLNYGFRRLFGTNPYDYYQRIRFDQAKELLSKGDLVESVAFTLGYESSTTFIKAFRARFGVTPKKWRG